MPITFLHSAWWDVGPIEFSVWHTPNSKGPDHFTFRVRLNVGRHLWTFDIKHLTVGEGKE